MTGLGEIRLRHDKVVPAWLQPIVLLDLCNARGVDVEKLLHNTSLFLEDLPFLDRYISLEAYEKLLSNANRLWPGEDFYFQLGHQIANAGLGPLRGLLSYCRDIDEALDTLCGYAFLLHPGLRLRRCGDRDGAVLLVLSAASRLALTPGELIVAMTSLKHLLAKWPEIENISCFLSSSRRFSQEHYHSHLSAECFFQAPLDGLRLISPAAASAVSTPARLMQYEVIKSECDQFIRDRNFLIAALRDYLQQSGEPPGLPECARFLGTSISTLKRRLSEQNCSFQAVLDSARREQALIELLVHGASIESISQQLYFHDSSNFRRAFKRWTGSTPLLVRNAYSLNRP